MTMQVICSDEDRVLWKSERRKRVTASTMLQFLDRQPDWWSGGGKDNLIATKLSGEDETFDHKSRVRMNHGRLDEDSNAIKAGQMLGFPVAKYHYFVSDDRWPFIGASLDWLLMPTMWRGPDLELTNQIGHVSETAEQLSQLERVVSLEMKQTEAHRYKDKSGAGKPWINFIPDYYKPQIQTQMYLTDTYHCCLVGCLGAADMTAWLVRRDPEWEHVMDQANEEAEGLLGRLWE